MTKPERWQKVKQVLYSALEREATERAAYLDEACAGDESLRSEVEALLASYERAGSFFEMPAAEVAAEVLADDHAESMMGRTFGHYKILSQLGAGGMGEVYLAHDTRLGRKVALKLLPTHFSEDNERLGRFEQEAFAASALNHPNILTIYEVGQIDSAHYIATEFIEGVTLRERMRNGAMKLDDTLDVAVQVANALVAAHEAGIVHRDIKPENIMLRRDGYVKVLDFGLAKMTEPVASAPEAVDPEAVTRMRVKTSPGMVMGTSHYMSPEQARGLETDERTDIWSLGVVLYEMVSGCSPFEGDTPSDCIASILKTELPPLRSYEPTVPTKLERVVRKALRKKREERYQTAKELLLELKGLKQEQEFAARMGHSSPVDLQESVGLHTIKQTAVRSIAVLPFRILGVNDEDEYLGLGLADALITRLGNVRQLVIRPTSAVLKYTAPNQDLAAIGRELKVDSVLEGSVRRAGDRIRVTAQLVSLEGVAPLWTGKFDEKFTDALAVEDSISKSVAEALVIRLTSEQKKLFTRRYTSNVEAYQLYLKGRYYWNKRTKEEMRKAIEHFQQVIDLDPNYALAYAGLADCFTMISIYASGVLPKEIFPKAKAAAMKALEIDDTLAEAHTSLGFVRMCYDWDFPEAEREFKRAIEINPNFATAHEWYGLFLMLMGRFDEARAEIELALHSDPLSIAINLRVGWPPFLMHRYDEAIEHFRKVIDMEPNYWLAHVCLGQVYERKSMYEEALEEIQRARSLNSLNSILGDLGHAYARSGRRAEAEKVLGELKEISKQSYVSPYFIALIYTGLEENDLAFEWLEKAMEDRSEWMLWLKVHPYFDSLCTDPRFTDLLRRIGFKT
jgi:eukaryotic-like serine/threonine-protein kinase